MSIAAAAAAAAVLGGIAAAFQLLQARKSRRRQFEDMFVQRYWTILDRLPVPASHDLDEMSSPLGVEERRAAFAYLTLCEDEIELWIEGWISPDTWKIWKVGIQAELARWPVSSVWEEFRKPVEGVARTGGAEQFSNLRECMRQWESRGSSPQPAQKAQSKRQLKREYLPPRKRPWSANLFGGR